jgi:mannosylglycoprotein endo-beta-mannosidase
MGGNWGLDEALKRIPRQRIFNQVRLHRHTNLNLIRNWNGQSTGKDFFDACDEYGIFVW